MIIIFSGQCKGQLYSYPVKRWKKKKRLAFMNAECKKSSDIETGEAGMFNTILERPEKIFCVTRPSLL